MLYMNIFAVVYIYIYIYLTKVLVLLLVPETYEVVKMGKERFCMIFNEKKSVLFFGPKY